MEATLEAKLKTYVRLGTFLVELPGLSASEGVPCVAQLRRMRGEMYSVYLREQSKLGQAMQRLQKARDAKAAEVKAAEDAKAPEGEQPDLGMSEDEERNVFQVVASMRALLQHAVVRVFVDAPSGMQVYKVVTAGIGEHAENEMSLDLLERDYAPMINRVLVKSGLIPDTPFPAGPADADGAGPGGEAVRPAAEPTGTGVTG